MACTKKYTRELANRTSGKKEEEYGMRLPHALLTCVWVNHMIGVQISVHLPYPIRIAEPA